MKLICSTRVRLVKRAGWHETAFVLPNRTIGAIGEQVVYDGRAEAARYASSGSLQGWIDQVARPASGNSRLVMAISAAFAGPLNDLLKGEGGGLHLVGGSSLGKSTALVAAGSVWGGGSRAGFCQTWRATDNGVESVARAHSGTILVLDELGESGAREAGSIAYMLMNGVAKLRATRDAEARRRDEWRLMLLSAGEVGLGDKIAEGGRAAKAGQLVRIVDVPADAQAGFGLFENCKGEEPAQFARSIKEAALRVYGTAGPAFVEALAKDLAAAEQEGRAKIRAMTKQVLGGAESADGQLIRVAERFALIATAGEMARAALGLPWAEGEAEKAAQTCFGAWRALRGGDDPGEIMAAMQAIRATIERDGEAHFRKLIEDEPDLLLPPVRDLLGYRIKREGEVCYAFTATGWRETLAGIGDPRMIAAILHQRGVLISGKDRSQRLFLKVDGRSVATYAVRYGALFKDEEKGDAITSP